MVDSSMHSSCTPPRGLFNVYSQVINVIYEGLIQWWIWLFFQCWNINRRYFHFSIEGCSCSVWDGYEIFQNAPLCISFLLWLKQNEKWIFFGHMFCNWSLHKSNVKISHVIFFLYLHTLKKYRCHLPPSQRQCNVIWHNKSLNRP